MPNPTGRTFSGCSSSSSLSLQSGRFCFIASSYPYGSRCNMVIESGFGCRIRNHECQKTALEKKEELVVLRGFSRSLDVLGGRLRINIQHLSFIQCCGSVTFWSGSVDPYQWLMDPDPAFSSVAYFLFGTFTSVFIDKSQKKSQNGRNQGFFCLLMEWSVQNNDESGSTTLFLSNNDSPRYNKTQPAS